MRGVVSSVMWGRGEGAWLCGGGDESAVSTWCWLRRSAMRGLYKCVVNCLSRCLARIPISDVRMTCDLMV